MTETIEGGNQYKKGLWTKEEDRILMDCVKVHGEGQWNRVAKRTGTSVDLLPFNCLSSFIFCFFVRENRSFHLLFNREDEF
jgi:hypothetical protein